MRLNLFSILFLVILFSKESFSFDEDTCFKKSFNITLKRSVGPFGAGERITSLKKTDCEIALNYQEYQYRKTNWFVDTCREPIHIKKGIDSIDVLKKDGECKVSKNNFCEESFKVLSVLQNEGLIFAKGSRENLESDHGKVYCAFLLVKKYLNSNEAFNREESLKNSLLKREKQPTLLETDISQNQKVVQPIKDYSQKSSELTDF